MWSFHKARKKFKAVVSAALKGLPQLISQHGQPAIVVSATSYEQLLADARQVRGSLVDHLLAIASGGCWGAWH